MHSSQWNADDADFTLIHADEEKRFSAIISAPEGEIELSGEPDGIIATGYREPQIPLFTFTEYKRQLDPEAEVFDVLRILKALKQILPALTA